jgi:leucyl aminopeptidase (aminopeptidase T)
MKMIDILMVKGAKVLVDVCTKVKPRDKVLIITDMFKFNLVNVLAGVAKERGAEVIVSVMKPRKKAGQEPPVSISEAMKEADVVFSVVSYSITHTNAVKDAVSGGARIIVMTDFNEGLMIQGGIEANFDELKPICKKVANRLAEGKKVRLTTPGGTDLQMDITGRRGNALYCVVEPGEFSTVPTVEANTSPVEGSAHGKIVVDASIPYLGIGLLKEPIQVEVRNGFITKIEGGYQADILKKDLESQKDKNVFNIAEMGLGLNPKCRMIGIMLEDEGVMGTAHIGIGTSITLGGNIKTSCHYDLIMWKAKVEVDGKVIIEDEQVKI